jgi:hypothetical protein
LTAMVEVAQSGPLATATNDLKSTIAASSGIHPIAYRLCFTEGATRQCRWVDSARIYGNQSSREGDVRRRVFGYQARPIRRYAAPRIYAYRPSAAYGYAAPQPGIYLYRAIPTYRAPMLANSNPDLYPTGSRAWWAVMNRQDRGGRPN